ncbi:GapA-binding peptide SR1P [Salibacterium salarium]|uniref:GapA-binding peptide SR1P n=1 Tax=Salibacterium salarium TaxID=284579 RepID=A0A3R9PGX4_9BACI|nr:GapA-binding peptide SR1P [Salibacterium salarium]RSL30421.1 GapA-binding peptide SR1P [Salibacterium salarium]
MVGIIICQSCNRELDHFDGEKITTLYASSCKQCEKKKEAEN